jgi:hypothetical protein
MQSKTVLESKYFQLVDSDEVDKDVVTEHGAVSYEQPPY